ncbi:MAG TPA: threonylcarbamoyl-AMP synthase [Ruminococcaceae bacterium]|nr:threonylcarbamoyl-AMP synthase [Oscillospiraceae bacterium]
MQTLQLKTNPTCPDTEVCERAGALLRKGKLVAIPTETVYGLAANALDEAAVHSIFVAKGRPQDNPLIVHLPSPDWLPHYTPKIPEAAQKLVDAFWPGPLTIVLEKGGKIASAVSAGLPTVGFRCPSHPVASAIIQAAGIPLAAPSANRSGRPSPTEAAHVLLDLDGQIDAIVDAGPCSVGVESTVVSLHHGIPHILRPGGITPDQLRGVLGAVEVDPAVLQGLAKDAKAASPGMKYKHYAPKANVTIIKGSLDTFIQYVRSQPQNETYALCFEGEQQKIGLPCVTYGTANDPASQARELFGALRTLDKKGAQTVFARSPSEDEMGLAVYNRLLRAAGFSVIS